MCKAETLDRLKEVQLRLGTLEWMVAVYNDDIGDENMLGAAVMLGDTCKELKGCIADLEEPPAKVVNLENRRRFCRE